MFFAISFYTVLVAQSFGLMIGAAFNVVPLDIVRFLMFFAISFYTVLVAQSFGLMIGAAFNVVVSIFPTTSFIINSTNTMSSQPLDIIRFISFYTVLVVKSFGLMMITAAFKVVVSIFHRHQLGRLHDQSPISVRLYTMSSKPLDIIRFMMFFPISFNMVLLLQCFDLMIDVALNVVNGTFLGPTLSVPMMMFAGFGVTLRDLPPYLAWGSYVSYLRYGLEGFIGAIYGMERPILDCVQAPYCHYRYPRQFLEEVAMSPDMFWFDVLALTVTVLVLRTLAFFLLKWKLAAVR
ncbi:ABC-2 type transporter domain-containing protein [Phthorimaea operculella]|nr:ABC-2 type transporter domain-containing protein [Phthorimaea operculella]